MIRSFIISLAGLYCGTALAADVTLLEPPPSPPACSSCLTGKPSAFSWAGGYVGVQVGWNWGKDGYTELDRWDRSWLSDQDLRPDGFIGGLHAGYNWQWRRFVIGAEADAEVNTADARNVTEYGHEDFTELNWQTSIRARVGAIVRDRLLIYGTGGVAVADIGRDYYTLSNGSLTLTDRDSSTKVGWTLGAGAEYALTRKLTGRLEYRYSDFGKTSVVAMPFVNSVLQHRTELHAVRVGISYRF